MFALNAFNTAAGPTRGTDPDAEVLWSLPSVHGKPRVRQNNPCDRGAFYTPAVTLNELHATRYD